GTVPEIEQQGPACPTDLHIQAGIAEGRIDEVGGKGRRHCCCGSGRMPVVVECHSDAALKPFVSRAAYRACAKSRLKFLSGLPREGFKVGIERRCAAPEPRLGCRHRMAVVGAGVETVIATE